MSQEKVKLFEKEIKDFLSQFDFVDDVEIPRALIIDNELDSFDIVITLRKHIDHNIIFKLYTSMQNFLKNAQYRIFSFEIHNVIISSLTTKVVPQYIIIGVERNE